MTFLPLTTDADVDALLADSGPVWIFKHSNACGVSHAANEEVEAFLAQHPDQRIGRVVVQTHRPVSYAIAERLKRVHQSPQLFLLRDGKVLWASSHWGITAAAMGEALAAAA